MRIKKISAKTNAVYKSLIAIKKGKNKEEFYVEGARYIELRRPFFIVCDESREALGMAEAEKVNVDLVVLSDVLFKEISDAQHSQGVLGVYKRDEFAFILTENYQLTDLDYENSKMHENREEKFYQSNKIFLEKVLADVIKSDKMVVVLDQVSDPGNVGAIIRTADAAGIKTIFAIKGSADPYSPKATRSSAGSILNVNIVQGTREQVIQFFASSNIDIYVADLNGMDYHQFNKRGMFALTFGNEAHGVSKDFVHAAKEAVTIPIYGGAESLNVSVAAGILIYGLLN